MEHYRKGQNVEEELDRKHLPIANLPPNFLWMQVRGGSKIRNLLNYAMKEFSTSGCVVWTGFGPAVGKTVSCAEIMKRNFNHKLHQVTKICCREVNEYWDPLVQDLDQLVVKRKLPMIHITLSLVKLNDDPFGYQAPGTSISVSSKQPKPKSHKKFNKKTKSKVKKEPNEATM